MVNLAPPPYKSYTRLPECKRHPEYYLDDGNLILMAGETLFSVWDVSFRRHSAHFNFKLQNPSYTWGEIADGTDDDHPLELEGAKASEVECLLWIIYPPDFGVYKAENVPQWTTILKLATKWLFHDIRELAIEQLSKLKIEPVQKIELEQKYRIDRQWAYDAYTELCSRKFPLNGTEVGQLGTETATLITKAREKLDKSGRAKPKEVARVVCDLFQLKNPNDSL